ncbi:MAG: hypothetical protein KDJ27_06600 [Gammaproteobacteria bacterium]|nr:hypothetical protein [Gammaproteobacteria bacterium]
MKPSHLILLLGIGIAMLVYARGLDGPFLFDDNIHITQNRWVKIESLAIDDLARAWNSSFSAFPANRPLAQLSFGINHAFAGLNPWAYKATNLALHLLNGVLVFLFARLVLRAVRRTDDTRVIETTAAVVAVVWLLHPLQVSTVLYVVQRMTLLSSLSLLIGLVCYLHGRLAIANDRPGRWWMLAAAPVALLGFLAKENAALMPLLLLVIEVTVLRGVSCSADRRFVMAICALYIAVPLLLAAAYLVTHPELLTYDGRPFTMEQRLLTETRVLWSYLRWLVAPDLSAFGLFHDDLRVSTGWFAPWTTAAAVATWLVLVVTAVAARKRWPLFAFAVLFFLANHALESSIIPLELVFEHRNYVAATGPLLFLAYLALMASRDMDWHRVALALGVLLAVSYTVGTWVRVGNWSSYRAFALNAVENHPDSRRSNFMAAQMLIVAIDTSEGDKASLAAAADTFLDRGLEIDGKCIDCLFGKVVLHLHMGAQPPAALLERLQHALANDDIGPIDLSISQFSFLVRWQRREGATWLNNADVEAILDAALRNEGWGHTARAAIESAYREYHEFVTGRLDLAEQHARAAVRAWPDQWGYHAQLIRVLRKQSQFEAAMLALDEAEATIRNADQRNEHTRLRQAIDIELQQR